MQSGYAPPAMKASHRLEVQVTASPCFLIPAEARPSGDHVGVSIDIAAIHIFDRLSGSPHMADIVDLVGDFAAVSRLSELAVGV